MGSFLDAQSDAAFESSASLYTDCENPSTFTDSDGNETTDLDVIWRTVSTELRENGMGALEHVTLTQIVVRKTQLPVVDPEGTFTDPDSVLWDVDSLSESGRGILADNRWMVVNLMKRKGSSMGAAQRRLS